MSLSAEGPVPASLILAACLGLVSEASGQSTPDEQEIRRARAESNQAIARHDVPGILRFLEVDAHVSGSGGGFYDGRERMGEVFAARFAEFEDATYVRTPESVEISASGPFAAEIGSWVGSWTTPDGPFRTGGRYMAYWRRSDGGWLIHSEVYVALFCEGAGCG
jgi:ketosteroid isomerase-like protein